MQLTKTNTDREEAIAKLREMLKPGDTVYTVLRHVSSSGMSRIIDLVITRDGEIRSIGWLAARAMGRTFTNDRHYGIKVSGCGMDMGFEQVYNLGRYLFPDGFGNLGCDLMGRKLRPLTQAKAAQAVERGFAFRSRNGDPSGWDNDGGYALNQRWL